MKSAKPLSLPSSSDKSYPSDPSDPVTCLQQLTTYLARHVIAALLPTDPSEHAQARAATGGILAAAKVLLPSKDFAALVALNEIDPDDLEFLLSIGTSKDEAEDETETETEPQPLNHHDTTIEI